MTPSGIESAGDSPGDLQRFKVLLAEDDGVQRLVLEHQLCRAGYAVESVTGGEEALKKLKGGTFQLLITDWDMPGMDGPTLCRRVREARLPGYLYIVMLTGHEAPADSVVGLDAGADDYVRKPPDEAELLARLKAGCRHIDLKQSLSAALAEVKRLSITDALTGAFNRGHLDKELPREIERACRYSRSLAVVMADLDGFKQINDVHGHGVGDQVIRCFIDRARALIRPSSDWIARYGGEEFVIVLPESDGAAAQTVAEKIRLACASVAMETSVGPLTVTASFGVAALQPSAYDDPVAANALLQQADAAMYCSKRAGRNRVMADKDSV
jgi:two-component system, cell cycle response regulator